MIIAMEKYGSFHAGIQHGIFLDEIRAYHALIQGNPGYVWNMIYNTITGQQMARMEWVSKMDGFIFNSKWEGSFFETKIG